MAQWVTVWAELVRMPGGLCAWLGKVGARGQWSYCDGRARVEPNLQDMALRAARKDDGGGARVVGDIGMA